MFLAGWLALNLGFSAYDEETVVHVICVGVNALFGCVAHI